MQRDFRPPKPTESGVILSSCVGPLGSHGSPPLDHPLFGSGSPEITPRWRSDRMTRSSAGRTSPKGVIQWRSQCAGSLRRSSLSDARSQWRLRYLVLLANGAVLPVFPRSLHMRERGITASGPSLALAMLVDPPSSDPGDRMTSEATSACTPPTIFHPDLYCDRTRTTLLSICTPYGEASPGIRRRPHASHPRLQCSLGPDRFHDHCQSGWLSDGRGKLHRHTRRQHGGRSPQRRRNRTIRPRPTRPSCGIR